MKNIILIILFVIVSSVSALFFAQNDQLVEIKYFAGSLHWQMNWVLVFMLMFGFIIGLVSMFTSLLATKMRLANSNRKLTLLEKEVSNLRALPITDEY
ncbi:MAG: LapA family protein [Enterobacterales bacterium]|nr:LapA family protein [Enterobacterales bacterium]